jgi:hypothetical protein
LVLTDNSVSTTAAIKKLDAYTGTLKATRVLTLTATPNVTAGSEATSYKWVLPETVVVTSSTLSSNLEADGIGTRTVTTEGNVLEFTLTNVTNEASFKFSVYGVNGNGISATSKDLTCTSAAPKTPGAITTPALAAPKFNPSCATSKTITVQVPSVLGVSYAWTVAGSTNRIVSGQGTSSIEINVEGVTTPKLLLSVVASTGTGSSAAKTLDISKITTCGTRIAPEAATATEKFSAVAYPNPSTEGFRVKSSNGKSFGVQVYDMLGRSIEQRQMSSDAQIGSNYAKGIYNVIVNQGANVKTLRVIKQ